MKLDVGHDEVIRSMRLVESWKRQQADDSGIAL